MLFLGVLRLGGGNTLGQDAQHSTANGPGILLLTLNGVVMSQIPHD